MGVLRASSRFRKLGEVARGLRSSDGNVPDPGVWREDADDEVLELARLSKPAAAIVAVAVAEAIIACR